MTDVKNFSLIAVILSFSALLADTKSTELKMHGATQGHQSNGNAFSYRSVPIRHSNYLLEKKRKCSWSNFHGARAFPAAKKSRYPTLDKIVNRLDNRIDRKFTSLRPRRRWDETMTDTIAEKRSKYTYTMVWSKNKSSTADFDKTHFGNDNVFVKQHKTSSQIDVNFGGHHGRANYDNKNNDNIIVDGDDGDEDDDDDDDEDDDDDDEGDGNELEEKKNDVESVPPLTTSKPWDEQQDIVAQLVKSSQEPNYKGSSSFPSEMEEKSEKFNEEPTPRSPLRSRFTSGAPNGESRKRKIVAMPYVAAHEHYEHVLRNGDCHLPKEKVIRVHDVHPDPSKSYSPSCTILHQCGDDTGCCRDLKDECKAKNTTQVELYFFTTTLGKPQTVEKLHFVNHTECECRRRTDESMPRDSEFSVEREQKIFGHRRKIPRKCVCPSEYSPREIQKGACTCDCFHRQENCLLLKKGKIHFARRDQVCIRKGACSLPSCEFGSYIGRFGRCPNRRDNFLRRSASHLGGLLAR